MTTCGTPLWFFSSLFSCSSQNVRGILLQISQTDTSPYFINPVLVYTKSAVFKFARWLCCFRYLLLHDSINMIITGFHTRHRPRRPNTERRYASTYIGSLTFFYLFEHPALNNLGVFRALLWLNYKALN